MTLEAGRPRTVLGLNPGFGGFNFHDPAAALLRDGVILSAVEEERFKRQKHAPGLFPAAAITSCLAQAGLALEDVEVIAVGYSPARWRERLGVETMRALAAPGLQQVVDRGRRGLRTDMHGVLDAIAATVAALTEIQHRSAAWITDSHAAMRIAAQAGWPGLAGRIVFVDHHRAHALAALHASGFPETAVVVLDGVGEFAAGTVWNTDQTGLRCILETSLPNSLGYFYAAATAFLGFTPWQDEGTTMALAPYGRADPALAERLDKVARLTPDGFDVTELVGSSLGFGLSLDVPRARSCLAQAMRLPPRAPEQPLTDDHRNLAWLFQAFLEDAASRFARHALATTKRQRLCVAGGVFLNCKLNGVLRPLVAPGHFYAFPVSGDAGLAVGAALAGAAVPDPERIAMPSLALGPQDDPAAITAALEQAGLPIVELSDAPAALARVLAHQHVAFWYWGRAEYGPRALGRRSILADPRDATVAMRINRRIKRRAEWRPFAPSLLHTEAGRVLEGVNPNGPLLTMTETYTVRREWRTRIPAVLHPADFSTRPHTVSPQDGLYYHVIDAFFRLTGVPLLLNTSLNGPGEPIANRPEHVIALFFTSDADLLAFGDRIVIKPDRWEAIAPLL